MKVIAIISAGLLLSACGGANAPATPSGAQEAPPPVPMPTDAFSAAVLALLRGAPADGEPVDVEGTPLSAADGSEPLGVE